MVKRRRLPSSFLILSCCGVFVSAGVGRAAPPGTILAVSFEEGQGDTAADSSGAGNDGRMGRAGSWGQGRSGGGLVTDGTGRGFVVQSLQGVSGRELSVAFWVKVEEQSGCTTLFAYAQPDDQRVFMSIGGISELGVWMERGWPLDVTGAAIDDGAWHHVAVTWASLNGEVHLYVDGVERAWNTDAGRELELPDGAVVVLGTKPGKWSDECPVAGSFDELIVVDRVLAPAEVELLASLQEPPQSGQGPGGVEALEGVALSTSEVALVWAAPSTGDSPAVAYNVYRDGQLIGSTGLRAYLDRSAAAGSTHTYEVESVDAAGRRSQSRISVSVSVPASGHVLDILPPGHWYEVPHSSLVEDLGKENPPKVMGPWSGGLYDSQRDRLVIWGGGHGDYWGNELYAFDVSSLRWIQLTQPTPHDSIPDPNTENTYPDGRPASVHTYNGLQYLPHMDRMFVSGGSIYSTGGCSGGTWLYDFEADPPEDGWERAAEDRGGCGQVSAYDEVTGLVWYAAGRDWSVFDSLDSAAPWTTVCRECFHYCPYPSAAIDPLRRFLVTIGGRGYCGEDPNGWPGTQVFDISDPENPSGGTMETTGATEIQFSDAAGFVYDPVEDAFVAWAEEPSGYFRRPSDDKLRRSKPAPAYVYRLSTDTWEWRRVQPARTNVFVPTPPASSGTYGRFRYMPRYNAYVLVNSEETDVFFYKLGPWASDDTPPTAPAALRLECVAGTGVVLAWEAAQDDESGIAMYHVFRDGSEIGHTEALTFADRNVEAGRTYHYAVSARNRAGLLGPAAEGEIEVTEGCGSGREADAGAGRDGSAVADGGLPDGAAGEADGSTSGEAGGGCGCRAESKSGRLPLWLLALAGLWVLVRRKEILR